MTRDQYTKVGVAAHDAWEEDAKTNPTPVNPHAYVYGFKQGAEEVIEHPERYELISYEDANQLFDKRADESAMAFRKIRDELEAENQRLREALEKISTPIHGEYPDIETVNWIAKEALKQ